MVDLVVRNVDVEDIRALDALAVRMGISRGELLRRQIRSFARRDAEPMAHADLDRSAEIFAEVLDEGVMEKAWR